MKNKSNSIIDMSKRPASAALEAHLPEPSSAWEGFWFAPSDPIGLHALRILCGLLFLAWLLPLAGQVDSLLSADGVFDHQAFRDASQLPLDRRPVFAWSLLHLFPAGNGAAHAIYWGTIAVLALFTLGVVPRVTGILTWLCVTSYVGFLAGPTGHGELDLLVVLAFYLMLGYVLLGQFSRPLTPLQRIFGTWDSSVAGALGTSSAPAYGSYSANLIVRLLQVHFALIMVVMCLHKLQVGDWWSGVALYYPLHPPFEITTDMIHAEAPFAGTRLFLYSVAAYVLLAWQLTFPFWAWRKSFSWRVLLLGGGALAWLGSAWMYRMPVFGPVLFIGCLTFLTPAEWRAIAELITGTWQHFLGDLTAKREEKVPVAARS